jgi:hypothetical protein
MQYMSMKSGFKQGDTIHSVEKERKNELLSLSASFITNHILLGTCCGIKGTYSTTSSLSFLFLNQCILQQ